MHISTYENTLRQEINLCTKCAKSRVKKVKLLRDAPDRAICRDCGLSEGDIDFMESNELFSFEGREEYDG